MINFDKYLTEKNILKTLIGFLGFGFLTSLDYTNMFGCVISIEPFWIYKQSVFTIISITLFSYILRSNKILLKQKLILGEAFFWILRIILFKGGYATGLGGDWVNPIVFGYDIISAVLRLCLIFKTFNLSKTKQFYLLGFIILLFFIKIEFFRMPPMTILFDKQDQAKALILRKEMIGNYSGSMKEEGDNQNLSYKKVKVQIDKDSVYISNIDYLDDAYSFVLEYPDYGWFMSNSKFYSISIDKFKNNNLNFTLDDVSNIYKFKLNRKGVNTR